MSRERSGWFDRSGKFRAHMERDMCSLYRQTYYAGINLGYRDTISFAVWVSLSGAGDSVNNNTYIYIIF